MISVSKLNYQYWYWQPICWCKYIGIGKNIGWENISVQVLAGPISVQLQKIKYFLHLLSFWDLGSSESLQCASLENVFLLIIQIVPGCFFNFVIYHLNVGVFWNSGQFTLGLFKNTFLQKSFTCKPFSHSIMYTKLRKKVSGQSDEIWVPRILVENLLAPP